MKERFGEYHASDPFFVVECFGCGSKYWSTRRKNPSCAKCGADAPYTHLPEHIRREMEQEEKEK